MKRCLKAKEDMCLGLLNIRDTPPQEGQNTISVQRLMGRRMKMLVPTNDTLLKRDGSCRTRRVLWQRDTRTIDR
ncbi:hypothetical protein Hamer_G003067 [Homarus americanus]|uniref:Uncharacterized protein n=1 Tax=Homarus americanus TaxID=6706 RepID=A0A8J5N7T0_HOMAM|nr:hypothetical protein Hamer_G003067 [Homarus americanus]